MQTKSLFLPCFLRGKSSKSLVMNIAGQLSVVLVYAVQTLGIVISLADLYGNHHVQAKTVETLVGAAENEQAAQQDGAKDGAIPNLTVTMASALDLTKA
jgi:hypothetical protein